MNPSLARYWRDVGGVLGGSLIAQLIPIAASLVIARLVVPGEFGVYAAWLSVVVLAGAFLTLRYEAAIPLEQGEAARLTAVVATLTLTAIVGSAVGLLLVVCVTAGLVRGLPTHLAVLGFLTAVLVAASTVCQLWLGAEGLFGELSKMRVIQACGLSGSQVLACWLAPSATSLAIGVGLGAVVALAYVAGWTMRGRIARHLRDLHVAAACAFLSRRRRFALLSLPAGLVGTAAEQMPVMLVTSRFGADAAGQLALAMRTLGAAAGLAMAAVLDVFRRDSAAAYAQRGECRDAFDRSLKVLALASVALVLLLTPWAEQLFGLVFGSAWLQAGTVALWLLPMFAMRIVASPLSYTYFVAERQGVDLSWQIVLLAFTTLSLGSLDGLGVSLQTFSWGYAALYAVYLAFAFRLSRGAGT